MNNPRNRLDVRFAALKAAGRKAFIPFATAGYPNIPICSKLIQALPKIGADIIEIGMPFSDPMADGPAIQAANLQAFKASITVPKILELVAAFRKTDNETPIVLMGYYNPIYSYGVMKFLDDAKKAGVDAFIIADLPPEEDAEFRIPAEARDLYIIRLITPTTDEKRLPAVLQDAKGFLYCVSINGITGSGSGDAEALTRYVAGVRAKTDLPIAIGFGVKTPEQAHAMAQASDGVIVASVIMDRLGRYIAADGKVGDGAFEDTIDFVCDIAKGAHRN